MACYFGVSNKKQKMTKKIVVSQMSNGKWIVKLDGVIEFDGTIAECYAYIKMREAGYFQ